MAAANENHLGIAGVGLAAGAGYLASTTGDGWIEVISNQSTGAAMFLAIFLGLIKLYGTTGLDVTKEVVENKNQALAILLGAIAIGLGLAIGK